MNEKSYHKGALDVRLRPSHVARWVRSSGDIASSPHIENIGKYGADWKVWYTSMMPISQAGRKAWPPLKKAAADPVEWNGLKKGSKRGFVLLLVSLSWWASQATMKRDKEMVSSALKEVLFVVQQLAAESSETDTSSLHKRTCGPEKRRVSLKRYVFLLSVSLL